MRKILDAWAILAWLNEERPASDAVQALLDQAEEGKVELGINMVNVGEVFYTLAKRKDAGCARAFWEDLQTAPIRIIGAPNSLILEAAQWKSQYPISYAEAFALATAHSENAVLVTGDPDFRRFIGRDPPMIEWIGRP